MLVGSQWYDDMKTSGYPFCLGYLPEVVGIISDIRILGSGVLTGYYLAAVSNTNNVPKLSIKDSTDVDEITFTITSTNTRGYDSVGRYRGTVVCTTEQIDKLAALVTDGDTVTFDGGTLLAATTVTPSPTSVVTSFIVDGEPAYGAVRLIAGTGVEMEVIPGGTIRVSAVGNSAYKESLCGTSGADVRTPITKINGSGPVDGMFKLYTCVPAEDGKEVLRINPQGNRLYMHMVSRD